MIPHDGEEVGQAVREEVEEGFETERGDVGVGYVEGYEEEFVAGAEEEERLLRTVCMRARRGGGGGGRVRRGLAGGQGTRSEAVP